MISPEKYLACSTMLNVPVAAIKAVAQVESSCNGFIDSKPIILFEAHVFWKQLQHHGLDPNLVLQQHPDAAGILYPHWNPDGYGARGAHQWDRLNQAAAICRDAALQSCSWGKFQIMGFNWSSCGCASLQEFVNKMFQNEDSHLDLFCHYVHTTALDVYLRNLNWAGFALHYNGTGFKQNRYDTHLAAAFLQFSQN